MAIFLLINNKILLFTMFLFIYLIPLNNVINHENNKH